MHARQRAAATENALAAFHTFCLTRRPCRISHILPYPARHCVHARDVFVFLVIRRFLAACLTGLLAVERLAPWVSTGVDTRRDGREARADRAAVRSSTLSQSVLATSGVLSTVDSAACPAFAATTDERGNESPNKPEPRTSVSFSCLPKEQDTFGKDKFDMKIKVCYWCVRGGGGGARGSVI